MKDAPACTSLPWIKGELDELVAGARHALEDHVEGGGGAASIQACLEKLHQIHGALRMVQLYGASMLAEEMELVADALREGDVSRHAQAAETLMRAMIQLPDYLEKIQSGHRDIPLLILPLMNDLRAARDADLLSEVALFAPALEQRLTDVPAGGTASEELPRLARRLRRRYHQGLLDWYRPGDPETGLRLLAKVMARLEAAAGTVPAQRLFRIAGAAVAALREGAIEPGGAVKLLLGRLDRQIKLLMDQGEAALVNASAIDLQKNLLYYVGRADTANPKVRAVKDAFDLETLLPSAEEIEAGREGLSAPNRQLLGALRDAIRNDLVQVRDRLDLFIRGGAGDPGELRALEQPLRKIGDTLGMAGRGELRERLKAQADRIGDITQDGAVPDESALMDIAGDILFVETSLSNLAPAQASPAAIEKARQVGIEPEREGEFGELVQAVFNEANVDMARVKEAIVAFIESPDDKRVLAEVPGRFFTVAGALRMLGLPDAPGLLEFIACYLDSRLLHGDGVPDAGQIDLLADAITGIEYYMEAVIEGRTGQDALLEVARQSLTRLGWSQGDEAGSVAAPAGAGEAEEPAGPAAPAGEAEPLPPAGVPVFEELDSEISDIFVEEAREELAAIQEYLPRWRRNQDDLDALASFRRSFHTLKGSGRLVGAQAIGELAWAVENLLNRILDRSVSVSPAVLDLLDEVMARLPGLIDRQEAGEAPPLADVQPLMDRASGLANPEEPGAGAADEAPAQEMSSEAAAEDTENLPPEPAAPPPIAMEPELLEIFQNETRGHLAVIKDFLEPCAGDGKPDERLSRAFHTLHGSAHMAGVEPMAGISGALEAYVNALAGLGRPVDEEARELIARGAEAIESLLMSINAADAPCPDWFPLLEEIDRRLEALGGADGAEAAPGPQDEAAEELLDELVLEESDAPFLEEGEEDELLLMEEDEAPVLEGPAPEISPEAPEGGPEAAVPEEAGQAPPEEEADPELVAVFLDEARELMDAMESSLQHWTHDPADPNALGALLRTLHTLKGSARLAGVMAIGDLSHVFESLLEGVDRGQVVASPELLALTHHAADRLMEQIDEVGKGRPAPMADELIVNMEACLTGTGAPAEELLDPDAGLAPDEAGVERERPDGPGEPETGAPPEVQIPLRDDSKLLAFPVAQSGGEQEGPAPVVRATTEQGAAVRPAVKPGKGQVRVREELLDRLVNNAGEVSIFRARLEQQNSILSFNLSEMEQTVNRLHRQLRNLEIETEAQILFRYEREQETGGADADKAFDPLELDRFSNMQQLSRGLMETVNDLVSIKELMEELTRENETLLLQQFRVATDLQDGLLRSRMVPFSQLLPRLHRVVRQTCSQLGKKAVLDVHGAEGEMDRAILDRMIAPLEHILRNAVSHGIESPEARLAAGKAEEGTISLVLSREGTDVLVAVRDDGAGLRLEDIRRRAVKKGLLAEDAEITDEDLTQLILEPGFSTADEVTQISGRGVGMDVVVSEVKQMGGALEIASRPGQGTNFTVRLPLTLAISDALLVRLGEDIYAVPHASVEGVVRLATPELQDHYKGLKESFSYAGRDYSVRYLGGMLGGATPQLAEHKKKWFPLLLVRSGEHRVALQVDGLLGNRQIVVKSVGPQLSTVRWITGGTILGDGSVALILDVNALVRSAAVQSPAAPSEPAPQEAPAGPTVMVVDDSITVRKVTTRLLERHNMHVMTAKDGADALEKLQEQIPDIMLLDIEMPRMDGFEVARHMRNSPHLRDIPIIMITSRTGDKHRNLALELGVKGYLGKPYQEMDLLRNINLLLAETA